MLCRLNRKVDYWVINDKNKCDSLREDFKRTGGGGGIDITNIGKLILVRMQISDIVSLKTTLIECAV